MKSLIRPILYFLKALFPSTLTLLKLTLMGFKGYNRLNKEGAKIKQHKPIQLLGNGSSLNESLKKSEFENYDFLVVNRHVLSESYTQIKPKYYVLADPHFFKHKEGLGILKKIIETTTWDMTLFIPFGHTQSELYNITKNLPSNITLHPYNMSEAVGFLWFKHWLYDKNLAIPVVQNVIVAAIYIAISLKYKHIELYGVEHSWLKNLSVNDNNEVCLENPHFYDKGVAKKQTWYEIQHSHASLSQVLRMYARMFESYLELRSYADYKQVKIINKTKDSFIDAFERG